MELVLDLVANKLGWMPETLEMKFQESGLTNRNYVVSNGLEKVVVRVNGAQTGLLGINRQAELAAMEAVSDLKTAPELLYFDVEQGYMITRFIDGRTWESNDLDMNVDRIGVLLKMVHTAAEIDFEFSPYKDIESWIQKAQSRGQQLPDSLDKMLERLHRIQASRAAASDNFRGLCHNDPFANNFMDDGTLRLLDWEFAGMGDIMYDLACIGQSMGHDKQLELLHAYFGYTSSELIRALHDMDYVVSFWNAMWAVTLLDTSSPSRQGFDYSGLANYLFQKMENVLEQQ
ncbi:guanitoxin biosynthesis pre-guanitoxin N-oxide kinase GntI [Paenibacillus sp. YIM B09110]|uniref:guanitoxin biosynthesis pre-guanitoxin N-oxide kinase GntI n=1 Tax=Paenibacillus sp. YIM B09110 TaxID=3126102 RepID=UPI00301C75CC